MDPSIRAITRTLKPVTLVNPSHNSRFPRVHPQFGATTQEMSFRVTTQGMPRVYPISRATTQGISFWTTTQGMIQQSSSLRFPPKPHRPRTSKSPSNYSTMDPKYMMLPRICQLVVLPLQASLLVVQLYEPPRSQQSSSVSTEHTNLPVHILTGEHHNMNLLAHIITCSPPAMNLPVHDTTKHLLVQVPHHNI